jgi:hypothetical protein
LKGKWLVEAPVASMAVMMVVEKVDTRDLIKVGYLDLR